MTLWKSQVGTLTGLADHHFGKDPLRPPLEPLNLGWVTGKTRGHASI